LILEGQGSGSRRLSIADGMIEASDTEPVVESLGQKIVFPSRDVAPARNPSLNVVE